MVAVAAEKHVRSSMTSAEEPGAALIISRREIEITVLSRGWMERGVTAEAWCLIGLCDAAVAVTVRSTKDEARENVRIRLSSHQPVMCNGLMTCRGYPRVCVVCE